MQTGKHNKWVMVGTSTDRPKSVRNRRVTEHLDGVHCFALLAVLLL